MGYELGGSFALGPWQVHRAGYGAMQRAGDGVFGPPRDRDEALRALRAALEAGVDHVDTAQFYGAGTVNALIREALRPYPDGLAIVSKVASRPGAAAAASRYGEHDHLRRGIEENLVALGVSRLAAVNLRMIDPADRRARDSTPSWPRAKRAIAFVPFCPLGLPGPARTHLLTGPVLAALGARLGRRRPRSRSPLLGLAPNILLIPGTRTRVHLAENLAAADVSLDDAALTQLTRNFPAPRRARDRDAPGSPITGSGDDLSPAWRQA